MGHNINKTNLHKTSLSTQKSKTNRERKTAGEEKKKYCRLNFYSAAAVVIRRGPLPGRGGLANGFFSSIAAGRQ
jgi:hypothetical protein